MNIVEKKYDGVLFDTKMHDEICVLSSKQVDAHIDLIRFIHKNKSFVTTYEQLKTAGKTV